MVRVIRHRGPDAEGFYSDTRVALGHARLRILDLDPKADQPMSNPDGSVWVIFNGEIYNYKELRELLSADYEFRTQCDTESILAAWNRWGTDCVRHFNGMFAFLVYDRRKNTVFCARDRFGIKPLFYTQHGPELLVASEIKSLLVGTGRAEPNYPAMYEFLARGNLEWRRETFFKGVFQLLPGEAFSKRITDGASDGPSDGDLRLYRYYDLSNCGVAGSHGGGRLETCSSLEEACKRLMNVLQSSVRYRFQSDVPVGVYFSGGVDSTAIAAFSNCMTDATVNRKGVRPHAPSDRVQALTAVSKDVSAEERGYVIRLAGQLGLAVEFCDTDSVDTASFLNRAMWHMEMPFIENNVCDDILNAAARDRGIVVVLEGQGSDESQAGYYHHYVAYLVDLLVSGRWIAFLRAARRAQWPLRRSRLLPDTFGLLRSRIGKNLRPALPRRNAGLTCALPPEYTKYLADDFRRLIGECPCDDPIDRPFSSELDNSMYRDFYTKLQRVLRFKDRMSMAYSRELRVPFLDHRLVELMFTVPDHQKIRDGVQKNVLKRMLVDVIPKEVVGIPKNTLLRGSVSRDVREKLRREALFVLCSPQAQKRGLYRCEQIQRDAQSGGIEPRVLWNLSQIELWHRVFVDRR